MESIVFLDRATLTVPLRKPEFLHEWRDFSLTEPGDVHARLEKATIAVTNKVKIGRDALRELKTLHMIAVAATGFDCVDIAACREAGVTVCNVPGYSRGSVPEHVLALLLALRRQLPALTQAVATGGWQTAPHFSILEPGVEDVAGSTLGIIGHGDLGKRVETLAKAFGMKVLIAERKGAGSGRSGRTAFDEVLAESDVVTLHVPLTPDTRGLIGERELGLMKKSAILINTARGGVVDEAALADALKRKVIAGAGVDVLSQEPPRAGNPLLDLHLPNLIVTPHVGWASRQAQTILAEEVVRNMEAFVAGKPRNVVS
jgi:glycerate dehydrogenase